EALAMDIAFDAARDDLLLAVVALGMPEQRGDQQRLLHHLSVHSCLPRCGAEAPRPAREAGRAWSSSRREASDGLAQRHAALAMGAVGGPAQASERLVGVLVGGADPVDLARFLARGDLAAELARDAHGLLDLLHRGHAL